MPDRIHPLRADSLHYCGELRGVSLAIEPRRLTLLAGGPGAGALLRLLALLDRPDAGEVYIDDQPAGALDDASRLELRNRFFGYVFAEPFLLDSFTVAENVAMPLFRIGGVDIEGARVRTTEVLELTGLAGASECDVLELGPLDRHRVSLARALATSPRVLVAEDAALHLNSRDAAEFAALLHAVPDATGAAVLATAAPGLLSPDREIRIERGVIAGDTPVSSIEAPAP